MIHTAGPIWRGGTAGEPGLLASCYRNALKLAAENGIRTLAFPSISTGVYGYPVDQAARVAVGTLKRFLDENPGRFDLVEWVLFDDRTFAAYECEIEGQASMPVDRTAEK